MWQQRKQMDEKIKAAAKILKLHPDILSAVYEHAKEINQQFKDNDVSPKDNIYAAKIIIQDKDENWYVSQDEPKDDALWADARMDERDWIDDEGDEDDDDDGGIEVKPKEPVLL